MSKRILVVEDHEDNRRILRDLLTSAGYEIIEAVTGEDGVRLAETQRPDLILMDIQLPVSTATRRPAGSRPTRAPPRSRSSRSRPTRSAATTEGARGRLRRATSPSRSARAQLLAKIREYLPDGG